MNLFFVNYHVHELLIILCQPVTPHNKVNHNDSKSKTQEVNLYCTFEGGNLELGPSIECIKIEQDNTRVCHKSMHKPLNNFKSFDKPQLSMSLSKFWLFMTTTCLVGCFSM